MPQLYSNPAKGESVNERVPKEHNNSRGIVISLNLNRLETVGLEDSKSSF